MNEGPAEPVFNYIQDTYDNIRLLRRPAERLAVNAGITEGQKILDVACGTGLATIAAAEIAGDKGRVVGIDIADKLLDLAREKAISAGLSNVEYLCGDATVLEFEDSTFDTVLCAASIFFFSDIPGVLKEWRRVLRPGGKVAFTSFGSGHGQPMLGLFQKRLAQYEGQKQSGLQGGVRTDNPDECRNLLRDSGYEDIVILIEQLGFYLADIEAYWNEMWSNIFRLRLSRLSQTDLDKFKREHLAEISHFCTAQGLWLDVPTIFSIAKKR